MVKMVSLSNDAYATLAKMKNGDESFSKVVLRLSGNGRSRRDILDCFGAWGNEGGEKETQRIIGEIYARRHAVKLRKIDW